MGVFSRPVIIADIQRTAVAEVEAIIDTGSDYCLVPQDLAEMLGLPRIGDLDIELGDGTVKLLAAVAVRLEMQGRTRIVTAVLGEPGATPIIGANTLAEFRFGVDPEGERLIPQIARLLRVTGWETW